MLLPYFPRLFRITQHIPYKIHSTARKSKQTHSITSRTFSSLHYLRKRITSSHQQFSFAALPLSTNKIQKWTKKQNNNEPNWLQNSKIKRTSCKVPFGTQMQKFQNKKPICSIRWLNEYMPKTKHDTFL